MILTRPIIVFLFVMIMTLTNSNSVFATDYKVALRAHHGIDAAYKEWNATLDVLTKKIPEHTFTLVPIISLKEITQQAGDAKYDFVLTNPSSYVEVEQLHNAKALVTLNNKRGNTAQDQFGSVIFTHVKNTDILMIKDLEGKSLMGVSENAFGGWRVAWFEMLEQGFVPQQDLKALLFSESKTQNEVVYAVRDGKVDAGVVRTDRLERMEMAGEIDMRYFRILNNKDIRHFPFFLSTKLYPEWAFAALKHVPAKDVEKVGNILLGILKNSKAARSGSYVGWLPPKDYAPVRELMKRLRIGPYANK